MRFRTNASSGLGAKGLEPARGLELTAKPDL